MKIFATLPADVRRALARRELRRRRAPVVVGDRDWKHALGYFEDRDLQRLEELHGEDRGDDGDLGMAAGGEVAAMLHRSRVRAASASTPELALAAVDRLLQLQDQ